MSIADQLGFRGEKSELLALPDQRWDDWAIAPPALTNCSGVHELRSWRRGCNQADPEGLVTLELVDVIHRAGISRPGESHHEKTGRALRAQEER